MEQFIKTPEVQQKYEFINHISWPYQMLIIPVPGKGWRVKLCINVDCLFKLSGSSTECSAG
eukprot:scaffold294801_cov15-Prasinocladus_malaysianus.AAC.1